MQRLVTALTAIGALNWGLVAASRTDLVARLFGRRFGETSAPSRLVYGLVGLAGAYEAARLANDVRGSR